MTTPHDPHRKWARPTYEAGLALWRAREARTEPRLRRMEPDAMDITTGAFALACADATAVVQSLIAHGFLNPQFFDALKAEQEEK